MKNRPKHPNWEIEDAVQFAEQHQWQYHKTGRSSHAWGKLRCPHNDRNGCTMVVWGTSSNPGTHAKQIVSAVRGCPHQQAITPTPNDKSTPSQ